MDSICHYDDIFAGAEYADDLNDDADEWDG